MPPASAPGVRDGDLMVYIQVRQKKARDWLSAAASLSTVPPPVRSSRINKERTQLSGPDRPRTAADDWPVGNEPPLGTAAAIPIGR